MTDAMPTGQPNTAQLRAAIDRGATGSKVPFPDHAAAPLGTDEEAAGTPPAPREVAEAMRQETGNAAAHGASGRGAPAAAGADGYPKSMAGAWRALLLVAALFAAFAISTIVWG